MVSRGRDRVYLSFLDRVVIDLSGHIDVDVNRRIVMDTSPRGLRRGKRAFALCVIGGVGCDGVDRPVLKACN